MTSDRIGYAFAMDAMQMIARANDDPRRNHDWPGPTSDATL